MPDYQMENSVEHEHLEIDRYHNFSFHAHFHRDFEFFYVLDGGVDVIIDGCAEHAEKGKVRIAVENMRVVPAAHPVHRYCQTAEELCRVADTLGFAVCWDFGHAHISGLKQSEALAYVGKRLKVLHVNDNVADDDIHLPPFFGTLDWKDAMQGLAATGFDGLFNYEVAAKRIPASLRESFAAYLVRAAQEIQSYLP